MIDKVEDFYKKYKNKLNLKQILKAFFKKPIKLQPQINQIDLEKPKSFKSFKSEHVLIIDASDETIFNDFEKPLIIEKLKKIISRNTYFIIFTKNLKPTKEIIKIIEKKNVCLFHSDLSKDELIYKMKRCLDDFLSPTINLAGTFLEVFDQGVLIKGESLVGKSETALALIRKGHKFISDDVVKISREKDGLIGSGLKEDEYLMEIKDIGIIDIAKIYGKESVRSKKDLNIVINLEKIDEPRVLKRGAIKEKYIDILNVKILYHSIFVKPTRDISLLIETLILNLQSTSKGFSSKTELNLKLLEKIAKKEK